MREGKYGMPFAFEIVQGAIQGGVDSINQVVSYFQPYINAKCRRKFINEFGLTERVIDEYMDALEPVLFYGNHYVLSGLEFGQYKDIVNDEMFFSIEVKVRARNI